MVEVVPATAADQNDGTITITDYYTGAQIYSMSTMRTTSLDYEYVGPDAPTDPAKA